MPPLDLARLQSALLRDAFFFEHAVGGDAGLLDRFARRDLRRLDFALAGRALACELGALLRSRDFDFALLRQARVLGLAVDIERQFFRFQVLAADRDHRVLLDVVALFLAPLDLLGQTRQTFGVERIARVEELHRGLVELRQRSRFELEPVLPQIFGDHLAYALDELAALLVQFFHRHFGGGRAQRVDELAFEQFLQSLGLERAHAQCLRGVGHGIRIGFDAYVELGDHVDAHPVLGDQRLVASACDLEPQRVHVDRNHVVHDRQHERAAAEHDLLPAEAGAHEAALLRRSQIQPVKQRDDHGDDDGRGQKAEDEDAEISSAHGVLPC